MNRRCSLIFRCDGPPRCSFISEPSMLFDFKFDRSSFSNAKYFLLVCLNSYSQICILGWKCISLCLSLCLNYLIWLLYQNLVHIFSHIGVTVWLPKCLFHMNTCIFTWGLAAATHYFYRIFFYQISKGVRSQQVETPNNREKSIYLWNLQFYI